MTSPSGIVLDANPAAKALGYEREELVDQPLSTIYSPEAHVKMRELLAKWKEEGELRNEEMVIITKQGEQRTVLLNVGSVRDAQGNLLHSTSVLIDITERKRMEEALSSMHRRLIEAQERERARIARDLHDDIRRFWRSTSNSFEKLLWQQIPISATTWATSEGASRRSSATSTPSLMNCILLSWNCSGWSQQPRVFAANLQNRSKSKSSSLMMAFPGPCPATFRFVSSASSRKRCKTP